MVYAQFFTVFFLSIPFKLAITEDCPPLWFGPKCMEHCNCKHKDECPTCEGGCTKAYFGANCQYRDLIKEKLTKLIVPFNAPVRTYDDISQVTSSPLEINFGYANYFTWMEICFMDNDSKEISSFILSFQKPSSSQANNIAHARNGAELYRCPNLSKLYISVSGCLVLRCLPYTQTRSVYVFWTGIRYFKSVHISGGVNIALKQRVLIGRGNGSFAQNPQNLVDLKLNTRVKTFRTNKTKAPLFQINLGESASWIQRILVATVYKSVGEFIVNVSVDRSDPLTSVRSYLGYDKKSTRYFYAFLVTTQQKAKRVVISGTDPSDRNWLTLSEVLIFSECTSIYYGPTCEDICSIGCADLTCHINGECFGCMHEMKGRFCLESAVPNSTFDETSYDAPGEEKSDKSDLGVNPGKNGNLFLGSDFVLSLLFGAIILVAVAMTLFYIVCSIILGREEVLFQRSPSKTSRYTRSSVASSYIKRKSTAITNVSSSSGEAPPANRDSTSTIESNESFLM